MSKFLRKFFTTSAATEDQNLISPNVSYLADRTQVLMEDLGNDVPLKIKIDAQTGEPVIEEKVTVDYLTFTCIETGGISMSNYGTNTGSTKPNIEYSLNGGDWTTWTGTSTFPNIALGVGDVVKMKGINANGISSSSANYSKFTMTGKIAASGNIMSLIDGEIDGTKVIPGTGYCFCNLFSYCTSLTTAPELPATTLTNHCYHYMFSVCHSLIAAPAILPAATLARDCYSYMFQACINLIAAPELPATTIATRCCYCMFQGCTNMTTAPAILPATTLTDYCYQEMFYRCTALTTAPELPATTLASNCYIYMFGACSSLTTAPELPATTLAYCCYQSMFESCSSLTAAPELPATTLATYCYGNMFKDCTSLVTIENLGATSDLNYILESLFTGCVNMQTIKCGAYTNTYNNVEPFVVTLSNGTTQNMYIKKAHINIDNTWVDIDSAKTFREQGYTSMYYNEYYGSNCLDEKPRNRKNYTIYQPSCFLPGTQITLADNTTKPIEDITYNDDILVWNADDGKLESAKPVWLTRSGLHNDHYYKLTFSDGTVLKVTGQNSNHKMCDMDQQKFVGCAYAKAGDRIYSLNGIVTVVSNEYVEENVEYYNIQTDQHINCFAEGILTSDRYGNLYPHDENMMYVKDGRDIRPYSEFEAAGISQYWYDHLRMGESTESVEDAAKYIGKCEAQMLPLPNKE